MYPLRQGAQIGQLDVVKLLLENGAETNDFRSYGMTPVPFAAFCEHAHVLQMLLEYGVRQMVLEIISCLTSSMWPLSEAIW